MTAQEIIKQIKHELQSAGFSETFVSAEEHEDGRGAQIGRNYIKDGVWYTEVQAFKELGITAHAQGKKKSADYRTITSIIDFDKFLQNIGGNADWSIVK